MKRKRKALRSDPLLQRLTEASALGDRLRALRDEKEVSNAELADAMGINESTLGQILSGDIERPPDDRLRGAARLLNVSFESLRNLIPGRLREATRGSRWAVRVIHSGVSKNRCEYPPAVLEAAVPLFEGVSVFAVSDSQHLAGERDVARLVGRLVEARYVQEGGGGEIRAILDVIHPLGEFGRWLLSAHERGAGDMFGLSINAEGVARMVQGVRRTKAITRVSSVDLVVAPAAGGRIISLIEGRAMPPDHPNADNGDESVQLTEAIAQVKRSRLPKPAQKRLKRRLKKADDLSEAAVSRLIESERSYLSALNIGNPGAAVTGLGGTARISLIEGREERIPKMLDAFFDPKDRTVISLKECYIELTGDKRVTGDPSCVERARLSEAISVGAGAGAGVFAQLFGDSITRRMQNLYREMGVYGWHMKVSTQVPVMDFREQKRPYFGGYGDLPTVAQAAAYTNLTSPTDVEEKYSPTKRGGLETISLESIKNDDVGVVLAVPRKLAMAAKRTLSTFVAGLFTANSGAGQTLAADNKTFFHADHNNSGTSALSAASVAAGRLAMVKQAELDSAKLIGVEPKTLLVPYDLQETAFNLFRMGVNNDRDFTQSFMYDVTPVPGWTDANDWVLVADPMDIETIEIGFLDGMIEPELFVQNMETVGSLFDSDQWTYKIRHIYGGTVMDHRGFYKGIVV